MSTETHLLFSFMSDLLKLMLNLNLLDHLEVLRIYTTSQFLMSEKYNTLFFKKNLWDTFLHKIFQDISACIFRFEYHVYKSSAGGDRQYLGRIYQFIGVKFIS